MTRDFQRPVLQAGDRFDRFVGSDDPAVQHRLVHDTSWALLDRVRSQPDPELVRRVIEVADGDGIHDIAELWSSAHARSLAGLLWRLYLIRRLVTGNPAGTTELFDIGLKHAHTIDPIVVGVKDPVSIEAVLELCDEILRGAFTGDFAAALERAASAAHIFSTGAASLADDRDPHDDTHAYSLTRQALRFDEVARELRAGALAWRAGLVD